MKLFLFDVDMTLVNTGGAGVRALTRAFEEVLGIGGALEGIMPHGKTDPAIIREACRIHSFGEGVARTGEILDCYLSFLSEEVATSDRYRVLPGVIELLEELRRCENVALGLATGNIESAARIKLSRGALNGYFAFGGFGSDSESRTEVVLQAARQGRVWQGVTVEPSATFVIGDTPMDVVAGREAGFGTVAVATGRHGFESLKMAGADLVIADFEQGKDQFLRSTRML